MVLLEHETKFWKRQLALCSTISLLGSPVCNNAAVTLHYITFIGLVVLRLR